MRNVIDLLGKTFSKIKIWAIDRYHILFKSAAVNHLRIQELLKNPDGSYQLTVKFNSYSELKNYQKKIRRMTVSLSSAVAMIVVAFIVAPYIMNPNRSSAASFLWTQDSWVAPKNPGLIATHPIDTSFKNYAEDNGEIGIINGDITLKSPSTASVEDSSYAADPTDRRLYRTSDSFIALTKLPGVTCSENKECSTEVCDGSSGKCLSACSAATTCGTLCAYDGSAYGTIQVGTQCWFKENLKNTKDADGQAVARQCFTGDTNCAQGGFYTKQTALKNSNAVAETAAVGLQGICPNGWHIPSVVELDSLNSSPSFSLFNHIYSGYCQSGCYPTSAYLWSSSNTSGTSVSFQNASLFYYYKTSTATTLTRSSSGYAAQSYPVRCLKN